MIRRKKRNRKAPAFNSEKVFLAASQSLESVNTYFQTTSHGLTHEDIKVRQRLYGTNEIIHERKQNPILMFCKAFINPFIGVLMVLVMVSLVIDVLLVAPEEREWTSILVITIMVLLSVILRFTQEWRSGKASETLKKMVKNTASVYRDDSLSSREVNITELVPGDVVYLSAGDMVPADIRIIESKDLFVSQSSLTGESDAIEKQAVLPRKGVRSGSVLELDNICFMGSNIVSGAARGVVFATGKHTYLGTIAKSIVGVRAQTAFDKGISNVSLLLIRFMLVMVPFVFLVNGITKGDWFEAFIFAVSVAVGLTPEMLPMIVTANLSKGALVMARKKTIVKNLNAIQNFGAMNILCTDKTGTLTRDQIILERYINSDGSQDDKKRVLRHAFFNSYFQTGLKNLMDRAILSHIQELGLEHLKETYTKIDEIPFDFTRRRMSVIVEDKQGKCQIITKGAVEEMLAICTHTEYNGEVHRLTEELREKAYKICERMNKEGMRVLAVAHKSWVGKEKEFSIADESEMVLIGYLAFLDPPNHRQRMPSISCTNMEWR